MDALISDERRERGTPQKQLPPLRLLRFAPVGMADDKGNARESRGLRHRSAQVIMGKECLPMRHQKPNSHLPACWLHFLVCPRRYLAVLPSQARPSLFGSD